MRTCLHACIFGRWIAYAASNSRVLLTAHVCTGHRQHRDCLLHVRRRHTSGLYTLLVLCLTLHAFLSLKSGGAPVLCWQACCCIVGVVQGLYPPPVPHMHHGNRKGKAEVSTKWSTSGQGL